MLSVDYKSLAMIHLKSIKSQELNIPPELSVVIPQDYVNYTKVSWIDQLGVKRPIYPANNLTTNPFENPCARF